MSEGREDFFVVSNLMPPDSILRTLDAPYPFQVDPRFVGKPHRFIFTNAMLGDAGFLNSVQRGDVNAANDAAWTTHVSFSNFVLWNRYTMCCSLGVEGL